MNYRRGFRRLYVVLTAMWIVGVFFAVFSGRSAPPWVGSYEIVRTEKIGVFNLPLSGWSSAVWVWAIGLSLIPPLIAYCALFYVSPWIYRGFRSRS